MEWSDLQKFLEAVRTGSYTAAGRQLGINRTTVGRRVEALERALGRSLFEEDSLGYRPTLTGARLLAAAEEIERQVLAMRRDIDDSSPRSTTIRIAGSGGIVVEFLPELARFRADNPDVQLELLNEIDALAAITERRADLSLELIPSPPLRLTGVQIALLSQATYRRVGATDLPPLGWGYEFNAVFPGGSWALANPVAEVAQQLGLMTFNSWPHLKQAVLAGLGSASLWCFSADCEPTLERVGDPDPHRNCPLWLLRRSQAPPSPSTIRLIEFLQDSISKRVNKRQ